MYQAQEGRVLTAPTRGVYPLPREQDAVRGCSQQWLQHVSKDTMSPSCFTCLGDTAHPQPVPFQCKFSTLQLALGLRLSINGFAANAVLCLQDMAAQEGSHKSSGEI